MEIFYGILIPFLGTSLGAACVFFMKKALSDKVQRSLTGFAAGVMVAASVWSLLIPAIQQADSLGKWAFVPAVAGFWIGVLFLLGLDHLIPHLHQNSASYYVYTAYDSEAHRYDGRVEVTIGMQNDDYVEITSGLNEGDTVYYTESESFSIMDMFAMAQGMGGGMTSGGSSRGGQMPDGMPGGGKPSGMPGMGG